jgi:3-hydroxyisobutyrate dehydrogenase-like beta-hydroxyacid dehydrogenase
MTTTLGLLHPGDMGTSVGAAARSQGARVVWAREGRSSATARRAEAACFEALPDLAALVRASDVIISVCPPHGAEDLANDVIAAGFKGLYVDANAIRPERARRISEMVMAAGGRFVDGGIVGVMPKAPGETRFYLSGPDASEVAALFQGSLQEPVVISNQPGAASALKMAYAAWNKGAIALRLAVTALAHAEGVDEAFAAEWAKSQPGLMDKTRSDGPRVSAKAWRWVGEMEEIAATFEANGLPGGFHEAAGQVYEGMARFKDGPRPSFDEVMAAILAAKR